MGGAIILLGTGIVAFLLLYLFVNLEKEQYPFKLLILFFFFGLLIIIGQTVNNETNYCNWNVINSTTSGDTTSYNMDYVCSTNDTSTSISLYKTILWFTRITAILLFFYLLFYKYFIKLSDRILGGGNREED